MRYRLGADKFDEMNVVIIQKALGIAVSREASVTHPPDPDGPPETDALPGEASPEESNPTPADKHQGKLKIDATVADQMIAYPTDLNLLNDTRQ
ncbi:MAG: hypothetical protein AAF632_28585 [Bacteroidota bacterium]